MDQRFVYVLQSVSSPDRYYTGRTSDPCRRLAAHNAACSPHTIRWRPWRMLVCIEFSEAERAEAFEAYLKSGSGRAFSNRHFR